MPQSLEILVTWHGTDFKNRSRFFYTHRYGYLYGYLPYGKYFQESRAGLGLFFRAQCVLLFSVFGQFFSCQKIDQRGLQACPTPALQERENSKFCSLKTIFSITFQCQKGLFLWNRNGLVMFIVMILAIFCAAGAKKYFLHF